MVSLPLPIELLAENVLNFTNPQSITANHVHVLYTAIMLMISPYTIPAIVTEVSARFVATTTLRVLGGVR